MKSRKSGTVSSLSIVVLAATALGAAAASQAGLSSRLTMGPSLNKDAPAASSPAPAPTVGTPNTPAPAPTVGTPNTPATAPTVGAPSASPPPSTNMTNIYPTLPTPPAAQQREREEQQRLHQQMAVQPPQKTTAMERAGQLVRSAMQKLEPNRPYSVQRNEGGIELGRGQSINHPTNITTTAGSATSGATAASSANAPPAPTRSLSGAGVNSSRQEKKVVNQDPTKDVQQSQRGAASDQKMNVGLVQ